MNLFQQLLLAPAALGLLAPIAAQADNLSTTNPLTNFGGLIKTTFKF